MPVRTLLFADNDADFLDTRAEFLLDHGYQVIKAYTFDQAKELLSRAYIHLALLDIRLIDDDDEKDLSGLLLAKEPAFRAIPKIILTNFQTIDTTRDALRSQVDGPPYAVDYLNKTHGPDVMIRTVEEALDNYTLIDWGLEVHWDEDQPLHFPGLAAALEANIPREALPERVGEIEDLFRKLFFSDGTDPFIDLLVGRLFWRKAGRAALEVLARTHNKEYAFLVTCGLLDASHAEQNAFRRFGPHGVGQWTTLRKQGAQTLHFAGTAWELMDADFNELQSLLTCFREKPDRQIRRSLERLHEVTLAHWRQHGSEVREGASLIQFYTQHYGLAPEKTIQQKAELLARDGTARRIAEITFSPGQMLARSLPGGHELSFENPLDFLFAQTAVPDLPALFVHSPGSLDLETIQVDREGNTWLTDFAQAGPYPVWHDYAALETAVRTRLVDPTNLKTVYDMEKILQSARYLGEPVNVEDVEPEYRKAVHAILSIRSLAGDAAGKDQLPYDLSLAMCTLAGVAAYEPGARHNNMEIAALLHRLILLGVLCTKIQEASQEPKEAFPGPTALSIDEESREVCIGERRVSLTETEFQFLAYLFQHAGRTCRRPEIMTQAFGIENATRDQESSLLDTNANRMRKKIEPDPKKPQYLLTVHGLGFKLVIQPG